MVESWTRRRGTGKERVASAGSTPGASRDLFGGGGSMHAARRDTMSVLEQ
jgi:hypothetical protein